MVGSGRANISPEESQDRVARYDPCGARGVAVASTHSRSATHFAALVAGDHGKNGLRATGRDQLEEAAEGARSSPNG
jgi:hypothetical protein